MGGLHHRLSPTILFYSMRTGAGRRQMEADHCPQPRLTASTSMECGGLYLSVIGPVDICNKTTNGPF
ncbi:hypothetical protein M378DRAFT_173690, partial [Amanita muscaria Koide BX008]